MMMNNNSVAGGKRVSSARVSALTKQDIAAAARTLQWTRRLPKWTVIVDGRELPARPLVLEAAGVLPNDPTNSHQAVAILKSQGFAVRYQGKVISDDDNNPVVQPVTPEFIHSLRGCCRGEGSMLEDREREHRIEKNRMP
jgi:hypothetical protein